MLTSFTSPKNIVVATDFTDEEILFPHVIAQARIIGAHITLVHVLSSDFSEKSSGSFHQQEQISESEANRNLLALSRRIVDEGVSCSPILRGGSPPLAILEELQRVDGTRLMIGTHRHGFAGQMMLGSVADALLRGAMVPVFAIGLHTPSPLIAPVPRNILHVSSLKEESLQHACFALELAQIYGAQLTLLHVLPHYVSKSSYTDELVTKAEAALAALIPAGLNRPEVHITVARGSFIHQVVATAVTSAADWIVAGMEHDHSFWSKSNNAGYQLLAEANCPVMLIRGHLDERA